MPETRTLTVYSLQELRDRTDENVTAGAYDRALEWLAEGASELWDGLEEIDAYIAPELFGRAGITFNAKSVEYSLDRGRDYHFTLPRDTDVDVPLFLRAMQSYFAGRDYRGPEYSGATPFVASPRVQHSIDLRSRDARLARENGLVVHVVSGSWSHSSDEFEFDRDYEAGFSESFKDDCNTFLADLCAEALRLLTDDYEYVTTEEALAESADANEYRFTADGAIA